MNSVHGAEFNVVLKYSCQIDWLHIQKRKIQGIIQASKQDMKFKNEMLKCQIKDIIVSYPNMPFYDRQSVGTQQEKKTNNFLITCLVSSVTVK